MQPADSDDLLLLLSANFIVIGQNFFKPMTEFIRSFIQLLAYLLYHLEVFLSLCFVALLRLVYCLFVRHPNLVTVHFRFLERAVRLVVLAYNIRMLTISEKYPGILKLEVDQMLLILATLLV